MKEFMLMGVELIDLTPAELEARRPAMAASYARDVVQNFGVDPDRALEQSAHQIGAGLPDGLATEGQLLRKAVDGGDEVGFLWMSMPGTVYPDMAWLSEIEVADGLRGRGYGSQMINAAEADLVARGVRRVGLHVFGNNIGARRLYQRLGYRIMSQVRARPVVPPDLTGPGDGDDDLALVPMTQQTYEECVTDLATNDPFALVRDPSATTERALQTASRIAPAGVATEGALLRTAHAGGREVGWIWCSLPTPDRPTIGLVLHLEIDRRQRRRGLGRRVIAATEAELARHGVPRIGLSIPGRTEALAFADSLDMSLASEQMIKDLPGPEHR
ncbi:GNAT family N-acetyltransferase [Actinoplanes sp. NPDC051513]|uniref:GNAT family N-acetyltransferase n=1 Tax=Actinoplanes sp. NPDC051513 TaxID=3363908 RepID=UPI0037BDA50E